MDKTKWGLMRALKYQVDVKRNEVLTPATPWRNLENITPSERGTIGRTQTFCFHTVSRIGTFPETGNI